MLRDDVFWKVGVLFESNKKKVILEELRVKKISSPLERDLL